MKITVVSVIVVLSIGAWILALAPQPLHGSDAGTDVRTPVLVELFTSEGVFQLSSSRQVSANARWATHTPGPL